MSCNCKKAESFNQKLNEAKNLTEQTGVEHAVWVREIKGNKYAFMHTRETAEGRLRKGEICCYYLPDGTEITKPRKTSKKRKNDVSKLSGTSDT